MKNNSNTAKTGPVWEQKLHAIRVSVWENEDANGRTFFNTSVNRRFQQNNEWKDSSQLTGPGDLVLAIEGLRMALQYVHSREQEGKVFADSEE